MIRKVKCGNCHEVVEFDDVIFNEMDDTYTYTTDCSNCNCEVNIELIYEELDERKKKKSNDDLYVY
jgi:MinD superfamily P-loop ATPase